MGCIPKAFCSVEYVGTRTQYPPTDFSGLQKSVEELLRNNAVRAPRQPEVVLKALQVIYNMTEQVNIFPLVQLSVHGMRYLVVISSLLVGFRR